MSRYNNNNGKSVWGGYRHDTFPNGTSRRPQGVFRRDNFSANRFSTEEEPEVRRPEEVQNDNSVGNKLDRFMEKFDSWREETERRFDNLQLGNTRDADKSGFEAAEDMEYGGIDGGDLTETLIFRCTIGRQRAGVATIILTMRGVRKTGEVIVDDEKEQETNIIATNSGVMVSPCIARSLVGTHPNVRGPITNTK